MSYRRDKFLNLLLLYSLCQGGEFLETSITLSVSPSFVERMFSSPLTQHYLRVYFPNAGWL